MAPIFYKELLRFQKSSKQNLKLNPCEKWHGSRAKNDTETITSITNEKVVLLFRWNKFLNLARFASTAPLRSAVIWDLLLTVILQTNNKRMKLIKKSKLIKQTYQIYLVEYFSTYPVIQLYQNKELIYSQYFSTIKLANKFYNLLKEQINNSSKQNLYNFLQEY